MRKVRTVQFTAFFAAVQRDQPESHDGVVGVAVVVVGAITGVWVVVS
jgi:hypothetical protein